MRERPRPAPAASPPAGAAARPGSSRTHRGTTALETVSTRPAAAAVLLAGGRGQRMQGAVEDKVLVALTGQPVFSWSLAAFARAGIVDRLVVVYRDAAQRARLVRLHERSLAASLPVRWVRGGTERQHSVWNALQAVAKRVEHVFIHDCARPLVHAESLQELARAVQRDGAACLAHRVTDTIKRVPSGPSGLARLRLRTIDRSRLWAMETPQAFARPLIVEAYREVHRLHLAITDDASAVERTTRRGVTLVENPHPNPKITTPADLAWAEYLLALRPPPGARRPAGRRRRP